MDTQMGELRPKRLAFNRQLTSNGRISTPRTCVSSIAYYLCPFLKNELLQTLIIQMK